MNTAGYDEFITSAIAPVEAVSNRRSKDPGTNYRGENGASIQRALERCVWCGAETQLYNNGQPTCPSCCDILKAKATG
jgi:hypothetical protein